VYKNVASQKIAMYAWDGASGEAKTGDASNITAQISIDGGSSGALNDTNPTEIDAVNHPGIYIFDLTQEETNGDLLNITPISSTNDVVINPIIIYTNQFIPTKVEYIDKAISDINMDGEIIEGTITLQKAISILLAFVAGKTNGGGSTEIKFRNQSDDTDRITMTVDTDGNRSAVTINVDDL